jgi:exosome complex RNA-binding protein Rrp42 (RNase PH superfamily)
MICMNNIQVENVHDMDHQLMVLYGQSELTVPQYEVAKSTVRQMVTHGFLGTFAVIDPCAEEENILHVFMFRKLTNTTGDFIRLTINEDGELDLKKY